MAASALSARFSVAPRKVQQQPRVQRPQQCRRTVCPAAELDSETITLGLAAVAGIGAGIGVPVLFTMAEKRDKERIDEIRELNRATLKATGETLSEARPPETPPAAVGCPFPHTA